MSITVSFSRQNTSKLGLPLLKDARFQYLWLHQCHACFFYYENSGPKEKLNIEMTDALRDVT